MLEPDNCKARLREIEVDRRFWQSTGSPKDNLNLYRVVKALRQLQRRGAVEKLQQMTAPEQRTPAVNDSEQAGSSQGTSPRQHAQLRVAEVLDELKSRGYFVIHSIVRAGYDIDHAVVGPAGIFAVEFRSGYGDREFRNGDGLCVGNDREANNSFRQPGRSAASIRTLVRQHTGINVCVKVLVFAGDWRVKNDTNTGAFTASQLEPCFRNQDHPKLTDSEIDRIGSHLESCAKP